MVTGLVGTWQAQGLVGMFVCEGGGEVLLHLLPLGLLDVVLGWVLKVCLHLYDTNVKNALLFYNIIICAINLSYTFGTYTPAMHLTWSTNLCSSKEVSSASLIHVW